MAEKLELDVVLNTELKNIKGSVQDLAGQGAFNSKRGRQNLSSIESTIAALEKIDFSKLKGAALTNVINQFYSLFDLLDSSAKKLSNFSAEYTAVLEKIKKVTDDLRVSQEKLEEATTKQNKAAETARTGITKKIQEEGFTYRKRSNNAKISSVDTISDAYQSGDLQVFHNGQEVKQAKPIESNLRSAGILDYINAKKEADEASQGFKNLKDNLKDLNDELKNTPKGGAANPVAVDVLGKNQTGRENIAGAKESMINEQRAKTLSLTDTQIASTTAALEKQHSTLGKVLKQFSLYAIAYRSIRRAAREAVKTIKEVDRALTEQAMVTGLSRKQTYGLLKSYQDMAARLGTTSKEISSTMTQFLRQGRSINESFKLTEAAVSAAKVAGISAADSINYLTTAINGFRLSADDAMKVSDKFAAVAATAATSYEEIAIALSKVAAQANLAGMSIDYTTALLTKGIETTREAPETIGTALKTVIARMRELGDYGETLAGDTDINNVETQLAYIGIALRDANGELRSTEEVLNDLGGKWETLNANQQAAVAKALAGTRQQSRLIAMMSDYERVIELQEVAQRSSGATMAQMATYMEGMDAALNKVNASWEKLVSTITDSETVINLINFAADTLSSINDFLNNSIALWGTIITLMVIASVNLLAKYEAQKAHNRAVLEEQKAKRQIVIDEKKAHLAWLKDMLKESELNDKAIRDGYILLQQEAEKRGDKIAAMKYEMKAKAAEKDAAAAQAMLRSDIAATEAEITGLKIQQLQTDVEINKNALGFASIIGQAAGLLSPVLGIMSMINMVQQTINRNKAKAIALEKTEQKEKAKTSVIERIKAAWGMAGSASAIPVAGWVIAAAILAAILGITIAVAVANANYNKSAEKSAKDINKLSKEIFDLNKKSSEIQTAIDKFEDLDNKVLKTTDDLKEMNSILESAADSLSDEEKAAYSALETNQARKQYLEGIRDATNEELAESRNKQRNKIRSLQSRGGEEWNTFLTSNDAEIVQARDAMYALNNAYLYTAVDALNIDKDRAKLLQNMTQSMLEQVDAAKAANILNNQSQIDSYIQALQRNIKALDTFNDDTATIQERALAFRNLQSSIASLGDPDITEAFNKANKEWEIFASFSDEALEMLDYWDANIDGINKFASAIQKLGYDSETSAKKLEDLLEAVDEGTSLRDALMDMFPDNFDEMIDAFDKAFGTTVLNMGQNIEKFQNTVNSFYEKASDWANMSESDKTSFLSENEEFFKGNPELLAAFESGNYALIASELAHNDALTKQRDQLLKDVNQQLEIELAKSKEKQNTAYIAELERYKKQLEDENKVYLASLKLRYEQQQKQLDAYKEYLQKETDALVDSLEKRKEAYQNYFDAINKEYDEEEYEEKAQLLVANLTKLGSSLNADANAKRADLQQQLEELEKERLQTLREQAQEAMIKSIEDQVTQINDNLEKLLNNEQALLNAMLNDAQNPSEMIASLMTAQFASGNNTELGMQSYLQQMQSTFAAIMPGVDWSNVDVERQGDSLILNIMGKQIQLNDGEQQTIYDAIQSALRQLGYN